MKMRHQVDMPSEPKQGGKAQNLVDADDFKGQAMDGAYGQAGKSGCASDQKKIKAQFHRSYEDPSQD